MIALSWDMHVHFGAESEARWGGAAQIARAAANASMHGVLLKHHGRNTVGDAAAVVDGDVTVLGSISLNPWSTLTDLVDAIDAGGRWVWAPTRAASESGSPWDLELPSWWAEAERAMVDSGKSFVLATGHLRADERLRIARTAQRHGWLCSVTHSGYVRETDARRLAEIGCVFEFDLYTWLHPVVGRPSYDLVATLSDAAARGRSAYITSDAGQASTGNPYLFVSRALKRLEKHVSRDILTEAIDTVPARLAQHVLMAQKG